MILTKAPLRISLFGGGSDIPAFYNEHGGMTISGAIDKYVYIAAHKCVADHLKVIYSKMELVDNVNDIQHDRVREALKQFDIYSNIEICSFSDIPVAGTGLGSSSTFTVALIRALSEITKYGSQTLSNKDVAKIACMIELDRCKEPIGKQDQYRAAFSGFGPIFYYKDKIEHFNTSLNVKVLNSNLFLYNTGVSRNASEILSEQVEKIKTKEIIGGTKQMVVLTRDAWRLFSIGRLNDFGALLDEAWQLKKTFASSISNPSIDQMYDDGMKSGALGGKLLGAGGGGYMLFYVRNRDQSRFVENMKSYQRLEFNFVH